MMKYIYNSLVLLIIFSGNIQAQQQNSRQFFNAIKSEANPEKMEALLFEWEKHVSSELEGSQGLGLMNYGRQLVVQAFAEENKIGKAKFWIDRIEDPAGKTRCELFLVRELTSQNELEEAEKLILSVYDRLKGDTGTASAGREMTPMPTVADCEQLYATILYKKGEYRKALEYLKQSDNGELIALSLAKAGETDQAIELMSEMIFAPGHRSDDFKTTAKNLFAEKFGSDHRFRQLLDSAATIERKKLETKITSMEINEPAPDFELLDLNGNKVSLKNLLGKTVILDFWATWCQPCVASFPGMQKAVDYFENDPSVVFMFIHTMEKNGTGADEVRDFMQYKKYRFDVYMDLKDKNTNKSPVAQAFGVQGIPAKFVINEKGVIKYSHAGYVGEDEAVDEIKMMVELANKN